MDSKTDMADAVRTSDYALLTREEVLDSGCPADCCPPEYEKFDHEVDRAFVDVDMIFAVEGWLLACADELGINPAP